MIYEEVARLLDEGDEKEARRVCLEYIRKNPKDSEGYVALTEVYIESDSYDEASVSIAQAISLNSNNPKAHELNGYLSMREGDNKKAEESFREALRYDKDNAFLWGNIGIISSLNKDYTTAEEAYRRAISIDASDITAWTNLGTLLEDTGRNEEAKKCFKEAGILKSGIFRDTNAPCIPEYGEFVDIPMSPRLFKMRAPAVWNNSVEDLSVRLSSEDGGVVVTITYENINPDDVALMKIVDGVREGKILKAIVSPTSIRKEGRERIAESAYIIADDKGDVFYKVTAHALNGKLLFVVLGSTFAHNNALNNFTKRLFDTISLEV